MIGDFNEILGNHEKQGGTRRPESSFIPFRTMLDHCGMIEFPFKGSFLSWVGRRSNGKVKCRLDRAVGNEVWHDLFSHTNVEYLKLWGSDHRPVLARIQSGPRSTKKSFKFDKRWVGKPGFKEAVKLGWGSFDPSTHRDFHQKIVSCRSNISKWKKDNQPNTAILIEELKDKVDKAQADAHTTTEEVEALRRQLIAAFREEDLFWQQKSRAQWQKEGDRCTPFFFATTKQRRARNRILGLKDSSGTLVENPTGIERIATGYFDDLFTSASPHDFGEALRFITAKVSEEANQLLVREPSVEEIKAAVFDINPDKAPGPDGMTSRFYQRFWPIMGQDIVKMVKEFFTTGRVDPRLNQTNICLIPKIERPRAMTEFRPISLCNVSYKIISKLLCKRLKRILPNLISETQSAFMAGRLITDNILLAQENFHALRTSSMCKSKFMAIKTDMSKAYDRVEWNFLEALMLKMGFDQKWVRWMMSCVSSVSYQVLINGEAKGNIKPSRGLRQGDPLSPFLFIILTEALISLLNGAESERQLTGLRIARASPPVSHLLFADDSLFFCKADILQSAEIFKILEIYGKASGQELNRSKSSVFFGNTVDPQLRRQIKSLIGINKEGGMGMYLGLPEQICGSKKKVFAFVQERLSNRVNTWTSKLLSKGGKEVLIKSVAQALPTYPMSCYLLPQCSIKKLNSAISNFWWSAKENGTGLHWIAWDKICTPQDSGGLGFRDLHDFNIALLAKQLWRLLQFPSSLLARVLRGRYFRHSSPLEVCESRSPSFGWRSILAARPLLLQGLRKTIGSGCNTSVWYESWIPTIPARPARPANRFQDRDPTLLVHNLILRDSSGWNDTVLRELIHPTDIPLILGLRPSRQFTMDGYAWSHTKTGNYTVRSGYEIARKMASAQGQAPVLEPSTTALKSQVWKVKTSKKLKHFMWQALSDCVATCQKLVHRHLGTDSGCPRCGGPEETINHLLFECPPALQVWALSCVPTLPGSFPSTSLYRNMDHLLWRTKNSGLSETERDIFPWILWFIWKARNDKVFNGKNVSPKDTLQWAVLEAESWNIANQKEEEDEDEESIVEVTSRVPPIAPPAFTCQIDASWHDTGPVSGLGWCLRDAGGRYLLGLQGSRRSLSALHAELDGLLWTMSCLLERHFLSIRIETDCLMLITMTENQSDWPAFTTDLDYFASLRDKFLMFNLVFIPRLSNARADALAKGARARGIPFSHVSYVAPAWFSLDANLFPPV